MSVRKTVFITFGYRHGEPPTADYTVDVRDLRHDYDEWKKEAKAIIQKIEPGSVVAIGCHDGDDRSVQIATLIQKYMDNVTIAHRDLSTEANDKD
jgi:RNase adaptor protein for sRNA GlmZ degradation